MKTLIVSGGYIDDPFATDWIANNQYDLKVAADRGMEFFYRNQITPDLIVGDYDSVSSEILDFFKANPCVEMITLNPIKDDTDTEYAIRKVIERGATSITLLGATGSRLDHVLGNIELLQIGLENQVTIEIIDRSNRIRMINQGISIRKNLQFGNYVSLIPYTKEVSGLTLEGFRYSLHDFTMKKGSTLGISNEIEGEVAKIHLNEGILLIIESRD